MMQQSYSQPRFFGPYKIISQLGQGGFGDVYLAQSGNKIVALKVLSGLEPESIARFQREAEVLTQTEKLKYFARIHAYGLAPSPFIAMEFVEANDLKRWRTEQNPDQESIDLIFRKILEAMTKFHSLNLVHRDLKPQNILIKTNEENSIEPIIIDFGLVTSSNFQTLTQSGAFLGTPLTMAPEQWQGDNSTRHVTTDIWALGIIYYFLVTGEYPFTGTPIQIFQKINQFKPTQLPPSLSDIQRRVISNCLIIDPKQRIQSCGDIEKLFHEDRATTLSQLKLKRVLWLIVSIVIVIVSAYSINYYQQQKRLQIRTNTSQLISLHKQLTAHELNLVLSHCCQQNNWSFATVLPPSKDHRQLYLDALNAFRQDTQIKKAQRQSILVSLIIGLIAFEIEDDIKNSLLANDVQKLLKLDIEPKPFLSKPVQRYLSVLIEFKAKRHQQVVEMLLTEEQAPKFKSQILALSLAQCLKSDLELPNYSNEFTPKHFYDCTKTDKVIAKSLNLVVREAFERKGHSADKLINNLIKQRFGWHHPWPNIPNNKANQYLPKLAKQSSSMLKKASQQNLNAAFRFLYLQSVLLEHSNDPKFPIPLNPQLFLRRVKRIAESGFQFPELAKTALVLAFRSGYFDASALIYNTTPLAKFFKRPKNSKKMQDKATEIFDDQDRLILNFCEVACHYELHGSDSLQRQEASLSALFDLSRLDKNQLPQRLRNYVPFIAFRFFRETLTADLIDTQVSELKKTMAKILEVPTISLDKSLIKILQKYASNCPHFGQIFVDILCCELFYYTKNKADYLALVTRPIDAMLAGMKDQKFRDSAVVDRSMLTLLGFELKQEVETLRERQIRNGLKLKLTDQYDHYHSIIIEQIKGRADLSPRVKNLAYDYCHHLNDKEKIKDLEQTTMNSQLKKQLKELRERYK